MFLSREPQLCWSSFVVPNVWQLSWKLPFFYTKVSSGNSALSTRLPLHSLSFPPAFIHPLALLPVSSHLYPLDGSSCIQLSISEACWSDSDKTAWAPYFCAKFQVQKYTENSWWSQRTASQFFIHFLPQEMRYWRFFNHLIDYVRSHRLPIC